MYLQKNKWSNVKKQTYDGNKYDSGFEAGYAAELNLRLKAKQIKSWERQIKIPLEVNGFHIANYFIDFVVYHLDDTIEYVETKGLASPVWKIKWKIFEALYSEKPDVQLTVVQQRSNWRVPKAKKIK